MAPQTVWAGSNTSLEQEKSAASLRFFMRVERPPLRTSMVLIGVFSCLGFLGTAHAERMVGRIKGFGFAHVVAVNTPFLEDLDGEIKFFLRQVVQLFDRKHRFRL